MTPANDVPFTDLGRLAWRKAPDAASLAGSPSHRQRAGHGVAVAQDAGVCRPGLSGRRRLHGPRQLGDRSGRRRAVRLHAAVGHHDLQPHGDPAAAPLRQARRRHRPRSGAGLPRPLFDAARSGFSGCCAKSPSPPAISPRSSARPSPCSCCSASRSSGAASSPPPTCSPSSICRTRASATSRRW